MDHLLNLLHYSLPKASVDVWPGPWMGSAEAAGGRWAAGAAGAAAGAGAGGDWGAGVRGGWSAAEGGTSPSCCPCSWARWAGMCHLGLGLAASGADGDWVLAAGGTEKPCRDLGETDLSRRKLMAWARASERPVIPSHRLGHCSSRESYENIWVVGCIVVLNCFFFKHVLCHCLLLNAWWMFNIWNVAFKYVL